VNGDSEDRKLFVASISPQSRASIAATYSVTSTEAGYMIQQLLSGPNGLRSGGKQRSGFTWVADTNRMREACLVAAAEEMQQSFSAGGQAQAGKKPLLTSACPGWICYAEKTHPHILPHLSRLKSPQALTGTLLKSVLAKQFDISPDKIWHMAVMPCFDKKLEASRKELTSHTWHGTEGDAIRDVDCVVTARELLMMAESRGISFPSLPRTPLPTAYSPPFPDATIARYLFDFTFCSPNNLKRKRPYSSTSDSDSEPSARRLKGTSDGYLAHILHHQQSLHPTSTIHEQRGRNNDVSEYTLLSPSGSVLFKAARYNGFRNIQNLVRRLKPAKPSRMPGATTTGRRIVARQTSRKPGAPATETQESEYAYVEVMACPGGCTNGGGQIKVGDVLTLRQVGGTGVVNGSEGQEVLPAQREWLGFVDEAYFSGEDEVSRVEGEEDGDGDGDVRLGGGDDLLMDVRNGEGGDEVVDGIDHKAVGKFLQYWAESTGIELEKLLYTTYRVVESDVGKEKKGGGSDMERVSALAVAQGGGW